MSELAARLAPEIDRLVLAVNRSVGPRHGRVLMAIARELGLDSLKLIPHFVDFWLDGPLPTDIAVARLPYAPEGTVLERLDLFSAMGLLSKTSAGFEPTAPFRPLLVASVAAREDVISIMWEGFDDTISDVRPLVARVIAAVTESHPVAAAHRDLPPASDPSARLYDQLVTLRYIRQQDHVDAWRGRGMTPAGMPVLTALWLGDAIPADSPGWTDLESGGWVLDGRLTEAGRQIRDAIERETNARSQRILAVLRDDEGDRLVELLSRLPGSGPA